MPFVCYLMFITNLVGCLCIREEKYQLEPNCGNKTWPAEVEFETTTQNVIQCARKCSTVSECHSLVFYNGNKTCYGITSVNPSTDSFELVGAKFYKPVSSSTTTQTACVTPTNVPGCVSPFPLVANVSDSQLSSSSEYSSIYMAFMGKLNYASGYWAPLNNGIEEYIQVDFLGLRVGTAVITQGGDTTYDNWITNYTILISIDCVTFTPISDSNGFEQVFHGNTDRGSHVTNNLEPPVSVRCLRIHAQSWNIHIGIRFEVMGCIP